MTALNSCISKIIKANFLLPSSMHAEDLESHESLHQQESVSCLLTSSYASLQNRTGLCTPGRAGKAMRKDSRKVPLVATVPQLHGLVDAGGGPRGHGGPVPALVGVHVRLNRWVAPGVDDGSPHDLGDGAGSGGAQGLGL